MKPHHLMGVAEPSRVQLHPLGVLPKGSHVCLQECVLNNDGMKTKEG